MAQHRRTTHWLAIPLVWGLCVGLYMLFVSQLIRQEFFAALAVAALATLGTMIFALRGTAAFRPRLIDLIQAWRIPWYSLSGTADILRGLALQLFTRRGAPSHIRAVRFDVGGDDPQSAARRALAVACTTYTPNFIVLGIMRDEKLMIYHQILPTEVLTMTRNLGAKG